MKVVNATRLTVVAERCRTADTFLTRIVGLLNKASLTSGEGLLLRPCRSIHMFFMRFSIDAIFADEDDYVVGVVKGLKPFHISQEFSKAYYVIELPAGTIETSKTTVGDRLKMDA